RLVQQARKDAGLHITDRIDLYWRAEGEAAEAIREHVEHIADEVLATSHTEPSTPPLAPTPQATTNSVSRSGSPGPAHPGHDVRFVPAAFTAEPLPAAGTARPVRHPFE